MSEPASEGKTRIDGLTLQKEQAEEIKKEADLRGFPLRTYLRALILRGAREEGIDV